MASPPLWSARARAVQAACVARGRRFQARADRRGRRGARSPHRQTIGLLEPRNQWRAGRRLSMHAVDRKGSLTLSGRNLYDWSAWRGERGDESDDAHHYAEPNPWLHRRGRTRRLSRVPRLLRGSRGGLLRGCAAAAAGAARHVIVGSRTYHHFPPGSRVAIQGLNLAELQANPVATEHTLVDLNGDRCSGCRTPTRPLTW